MVFKGKGAITMTRKETVHHGFQRKLGSGDQIILKVIVIRINVTCLCIFHQLETHERELVRCDLF